MDPVKNPFSPGAGSPPPELVGRDVILDNSRILLGRVRAKRPEKSLLLTGLRGVGKTVLLNEIELLAQKEGYRTILFEVHEGKSFAVLLASASRAWTERSEPAPLRLGLGMLALVLLAGMTVRLYQTFRSLPQALSESAYDLHLANFAENDGLTLADVGLSFLPQTFVSPWVERGALANFRSDPALPSLRYCFVHREDDHRAMVQTLLASVLSEARFDMPAGFVNKA